jgi:hypothetical protein
MTRPESITQTDRNRGLRDRLSRMSGEATDLGAAELEVAVKNLQDLARNRLA